MTRLLIRSGKDPFTPVAPESTLTQDVFNSNTGNYCFQHSVWRALSVDGAELVSNGTLSERVRPQRGDAERINEEFDHFVIPMANAFRPDFTDRLDRLSELIEGLTIPVTVVGIGAQTKVTMDAADLAEVDDSTRRFVSAVLERSASIGVRGDFTRKYLVGLGFPDSAVDVIGCPSLYLHGPDLVVDKKVAAIGPDSRLAINLTPEVPGIGGFATQQAERHPRLVYVGQDQHDLRLLAWGVPFPHVHDPLAPVHLHHPLYQQDRQRVFVDTWTWYDFLAEQEFVYGTRFHGNVAALLGGTPALLLAHDSRTVELADYHQMPYRLMPEFTTDLRADELYEATDLSAFNAATPENFARYTAFLEKNGLTHRWQDGAGGGDFDERLAAATFPPAVRPLIAADGSEVAARLQWLRDGMVLDITRHPRAYKPPFPHPPWNGAGSRHARVQATTAEQIETQRREIDALSERLERLERSSPRGLGRRVAARLKRMLRRP